MHISKALAEIESMRPAVAEAAAIFDDYEAYLLAWSLRGAIFERD